MNPTAPGDRARGITPTPNKMDNAQKVAEYARGEFQGMPASVLVAIASGEIDATRLAARTLANSGLDYRTGQWVGFPAAAALFAAKFLP